MSSAPNVEAVFKTNVLCGAIEHHAETYPKRSVQVLTLFHMLKSSTSCFFCPGNTDFGGGSCPGKLTEGPFFRFNYDADLFNFLWRIYLVCLQSCDTSPCFLLYINKSNRIVNAMDIKYNSKRVFFFFYFS